MRMGTIVRTGSCAVALMLGLAVAGCSKEESATPQTTAADASSKAKDMVNSAMSKASDTASTAVDTAKDAANKVSAEADEKINQITTYIKENKYDLADKALTELEKIKAQLPEPIQAKLTSARSALDSAKAAMPKM